ncbi:biotin/lipoyl-binding protein [Ruegeria pomeroyi]|uniref:Acetyl-CoA carboxylase, biotin carboxylase, putative n=2 Tax=Ruegeria pomeroyi TaxID=89184 RepID=Q5LVW6_RUEPO|nr:biotin carboxylase N-terminal domain-containing protein [Ruegeria pomeroyi]AAV93894.1 acetyl-CoA carboxylase, biotin carboxylase, putative [Ruegeria pomeroyi DSS-3]NVK95447.1 biotin/lipoyl-binding protein [Ruegeria pomeroyi]NVL02977.1 biotin/lipoyl-binding protein [Ruegeria pomeroyi]QWV07482.1 biotin/lipoyl-binding protein [Ruegeria pomeroyi]
MMRFDTLLIANRGEIAVRIIRTAREMGLRTVAVYTTADAGAPHVALADHAVWIGEGPVGDSYLNADRILDAARQSGAGAIHPGYGFLSENAGFARAVAAAGLVFVGPDAAAIEAMGNKAEAKRLMLAAGVPCVPGYQGADQSDAALTREAEQIGYPLMVKAAAGGGGRGMRLVEGPGALSEALARARAEALGAFGSDELILERAVVEPRHVEFQVFGDAHGAVIHLGERDCSVQRRHQKVIEEAPCPVMTPELRDAMGAAAVAAARAVDYRGAGTVEFLLDASGGFYFLEMNTRLQVEHPVTEMVTGLDLVALQLQVAQGDPLPLTQDDLRIDGHAIEVRLYAEDPAAGFLPAIGPVLRWRPAAGAGLRVDAGIAQGQQIAPHYDPMLAKIIAHGPSRTVALARLARAVADTVLLGTATNSAFLADLLALPEFAEGQATTGLLARSYPEGYGAGAPDPRAVALMVAVLMQHDRDTALAAAGPIPPELLGWSSAPVLPRSLRVETGGQVFDCTAGAVPGGWRIGVADAQFEIALVHREDGLRARLGGETHDLLAHVSGDTVHMASGAQRLSLRRQRPGAPDAEALGGGRVTAPMPGLVQAVSVSEGAEVAKGQTLAVLEAMKMQHQITAPVAGRVARQHVAPGAQLAAGDVMFEIEEEESA